VADDKGPAPALPAPVRQLAAVFDGLPNVMFSLKGIDGRYLIVNQAFADRAGRRAVGLVVGRTAAELFAPELAVSYAAQDAAVVASGRPVRRQLELITRPDGALGWYVTNKTLVSDEAGRPVAIAAVSLDEQAPADKEGMAGIGAAVEAARTRYAEPISASDLARAAGMPTVRLERRMRRVLGVAPRQLIVRVRVEEALHRIVRTDLDLAAVAADCGFSDHAAMTRQFRQLLGVPPSALREVPRLR
jgi:transcriptional regulator GlxA family with amidase domain